MKNVLVGKRIRLTGLMRNGEDSVIPVEDGMPEGLTGTIVHVNMEGPREYHQIAVKWDNGRSLAVLPYVDNYEILVDNVCSDSTA